EFWSVYEGLQSFGYACFGEVKFRKVDSLVVFRKVIEVFVQIFDYYHLFECYSSNSFYDDLSVCLKNLFAFLNERFVGVIDMPLVGKLVENVKDAGLCPKFRVLPKSKFLCNPISSDEADPEDVRCKSVGILRHHFDCFIPILLENLSCVSGTDAVALEENHHFTDFLLVRPGIFDHLNALCAYPFDRSELFDIGFDNIECVLAELFYDPLCHDGSDPFYETRTQVF